MVCIIQGGNQKSQNTTLETITQLKSYNINTKQKKKKNTDFPATNKQTKCLNNKD